MTIGKLHTILAGFISQGHARKRVCVQTNTFHCHIEEATILDVHEADLECFPMMQEDGGTMLDSGNESCHTAIVLKGDHDPYEELREASK